MHVVHLHSGNLYGGIERVLVTLARHGPATGIAQTFALCFEGRFSSELRETKAAIDILGPVRLARPFSVFAARRHLSRWIGSHPAEVIVTHLPWTQAVFGPAIEQGLRSVQWIHGPVNGWIGRWASLSLPEALICNSAFTRRTLPAAYRRLPAETVHYPLDISDADRSSCAQTRRSLNTSPSDVVIVQASRFEHWKGHGVLIRALASLAHVSGWTLWILGAAQRPAEVAYERQIRELVAECGLSGRCRFVGEQRDVGAYLAAADVYSQPNLSPEPFGVAYVEALAAGLPVVASNTGALPEIVDGRTGILVQPGDVAALARALELLVTDAAMRQRLAAAGPVRAAELCDPRRQVSRIAAVLAAVSPTSGAA